MQTIDLTPTWSEILPALLRIMESGNAEGRAQAFKELRRMAALADGFGLLLDPLNKCHDWIAQYHHSPGHEAASQGMTGMIEREISKATRPLLEAHQ